jgi:HSP20 family protein
MTATERGDVAMTMVRSDPFREFDRLVQQVFGSTTGERPIAIPMDAYRKGDHFLAQLDLPGIEPDSVELTVEDNVLSIRAERAAPNTNDDVQTLFNERPHGVFVRQLFLGDNLDTDNISADYHNGVLTLSIPVAERAKPRRISVVSRDDAVSIAEQREERQAVSV